jgi:hypothetical protein
MAHVTTNKIKEIIKYLLWKNSSSYDELPLRILKISMPLINPLLCTCAINPYLKETSPHG